MMRKGSERDTSQTLREPVNEKNVKVTSETVGRFSHTNCISPSQHFYQCLSFTSLTSLTSCPLPSPCSRPATSYLSLLLTEQSLVYTRHHRPRTHHADGQPTSYLLSAETLKVSLEHISGGREKVNGGHCNS